MLYFVCENARDMEQPILLTLNEFTEENLNEQETQWALMRSPDNMLNTITKWFMRRIFLNKPF